MMKVKNERSISDIILTISVFIILLILTINLYRSYLLPNFDIQKDFIGFKPFILELYNFITSFNIQGLLDNLYKAFMIEIPDISQVGSLWDVITGTFAEIGDLILFPIYIVEFLANIVLSAFRFLAIFFGLQLPVS